MIFCKAGFQRENGRQWRNLAGGLSANPRPLLFLNIANPGRPDAFAATITSMSANQTRKNTRGKLLKLPVASAAKVFKQKPSKEQFSPEHDSANESIGASALFSHFTADIIKENVVFTR